MKKIFLLTILALSINAAGLPRFIDVKVYKNFSVHSKEVYLRGSIDMLWVQLKNRFGMENNLSLCMDNVNQLSGFVNIYDNFLNNVGNQYDDYSASEIFTLAIAEHCKK